MSKKWYNYIVSVGDDAAQQAQNTSGMTPSSKSAAQSVSSLIGARALVLERVDINGGRVRIGGEEWSARAYMEDQVLEPGTRVEVARIEGATALVYE